MLIFEKRFAFRTITVALTNSELFNQLPEKLESNWIPCYLFVSLKFSKLSYTQSDIAGNTPWTMHFSTPGGKKFSREGPENLICNNHDLLNTADKALAARLAMLIVAVLLFSGALICIILAMVKKS